MLECDSFQEILDQYDAQIVVWNPVPELDDYLVWSYEVNIQLLEPLWVNIVFDDGSSGTELCYLEPETTDEHITIVWHLDKVAKRYHARVTHFMRRPLPPLEFRDKSINIM